MGLATIDIGSNSLLLTVVDDRGAVVHDEARVVGLGRGLGDRGLFAPDRMAAAEAVLADYLNIARTHGVEPWAIRAVATSAARRAMNAQTWVARVQRQLGLRVRIISGDEEARLTWLGALRDLQLPAGPVLVVDLGGGSTELIQGQAGQVISRVSLELGSVRLTERFLGTDHVDPTDLAQLRQEVEVTLGAVHIEAPPRAVIGVAGTVTTLAATRLDLERYDSSRVHGSSLGRVDIARFIDQLLPASPARRRELVPSAPDRADFLLAGSVVLDRVLALTRRSSMVVSDRGLRFGLLGGG